MLKDRVIIVLSFFMPQHIVRLFGKSCVTYIALAGLFPGKVKIISPLKIKERFGSWVQIQHGRHNSELGNLWEEFAGKGKQDVDIPFFAWPWPYPHCDGFVLVA